MIETEDPDFRLMRDELFGPVVTAYVYPENDYEPTLELVDRTAPYGLTGAVFADEREAVIEAPRRSRYAAGNFYVNDKPTGAVVGQQPFGGARASGTNDKAGSMWNLIRWVSPRTIKETFIPPRDYRYPFMQEGRPGGRDLVISISHQADVTPDGKILVIGDEKGGGLQETGCHTSEQGLRGGLHFWALAHLGRLPDEGRLAHEPEEARRLLQPEPRAAAGRHGRRLAPPRLHGPRLPDRRQRHGVARCDRKRLRWRRRPALESGARHRVVRGRRLARQLHRHAE